VKVSFAGGATTTSKASKDATEADSIKVKFGEKKLFFGNLVTFGKTDLAGQ
jgi:hypothetical protein